MKWMVPAAVGAVFVLSLCLLSFRSTVSAETIQCYECNSFNEPTSCTNDHVDAIHLRNCTDSKRGSTATMCRKTRQWVDFDVLNMKANERIVRSCGFEETVRPCYYRAGFGGRQEVCTCYTPGCNEATTTGPTMLLTAMVTAILGVRYLAV